MAISRVLQKWKGYQPFAAKIFVAAAFVVHFWTIFNMLFDIPSWILRMSVGDLVGEIAYTMTFALVESMLLALPFVVVGFFLSPKFREKHLLPLATIAILLLALGALSLQVFEKLRNFEKLIAAVWLVASILLGLLSLRFESIGRKIELALDRLSVLIFLFLAIDFLGLIVVLVRNL